MWIHECCLHPSFWRASSSSYTALFSTSRINTLSHTLQVIKKHLNIILDTPQASLYHFAFPCWSSWFYAVIVACKIVFLSYNEHSGHTDLDTIPNELTQMFPNNCRSSIPIHHSFSNTRSGFWDPVSVAREAGILVLFERFVEKLRFVLPASNEDWTSENVDRDPLWYELS